MIEAISSQRDYKVNIVLVTKFGDELCPCILILKPLMSSDVVGDVDEIGDAELEQLGNGISGVLGAVTVSYEDTDQLVRGSDPLSTTERGFGAWLNFRVG